MNTETTNNSFWNKDSFVHLLPNRTTSPPKKGKLGVLSTLLLIVLFTTCEDKGVTLSTESQLTQLTLNVAGKSLTGTVNQQTKRIAFDAGKLTAEPTQAEITVITLSKGATATHDTKNKTLSLNGGRAQIIVTAEDKKTKSAYTVEVAYQLLGKAEITAFTLTFDNILQEPVEGNIDNTAGSTTFDLGKVPSGTVFSEATITVLTLSEGTTADHDTGDNNRLAFENDRATITLTSPDGTTKVPHTVKLEYTSTAAITAIEVQFGENNVTGTIEGTTVKLDIGELAAGIQPPTQATITMLTISEGATADHDTGDNSQLVFENNQDTITLTSPDGTTKVPYVVTLVYTSKEPLPTIAAIEVQFGENNVTGTIEGTTITLDIGAVGDGNPLPVAGVITALTLSEGASSTQGPASDGKQDELNFANGAAQIEVSNEAGDTQTYTIQIEYSVTGTLGQLVLQVETTDYPVNFENNSGTILLKGGAQIPATATVSNVILGEGVTGLTAGDALPINEDQVTFTLTDGEGTEHVYTVQLLLIDRYRIADAGFLAYLKEVLPSDAFVAEDTLLVSHASVQMLTGITATSRSISSLDGIQFFTEITVLNCSNNSIESLDLSQNTALTTLNCSNNSIESLDPSKNTALTTLNCSNNSIGSLDPSQNTALTTLNCSNNSIESLDLSSHMALANLNCASNRVLSSLTLPPHSTARTATWNELLCDNNILTTLNLQGVRNADVNMNLFAVNTSYDNYTALRVNTALQNHDAVASVKDGREEELTISTYDNDNSLVCSDYDPREATRGCKDNQPLRSLTLTIATADYLATFDENNNAKITLPENTPIPITTTVKAISLRSGASGPAVGSMLSIIGGSIALQATPSTSGNAVNYTITIEGGLIPQLLTFGFNEADNSDGDDNTAGALVTLEGGAQYPGTVDQEARTVAVVVDAYARTFDISRLSAYFTLPVGASATVGDVVQTTGITANNFSSAVTYRIALAGSAPVDYTVMVRKTNTAPIPDGNFRAALQTMLSGEAFQQDSLVTDHVDVIALQNIDAANRSIASLKGVEFFVGLTTLSCDRNNLTALDLSLNTALTTLNCMTNNLAALNLANNTALIELNCSVNKLSSLNLASNTALATLNCFRNYNLSSLILPEWTSERATPWTHIDCSYSNLTSLDLRMVRNAGAGITIYADNPPQDQLTSLQVNTAIQNNFGVRHLKDQRDDAVIISTYDNDGQLVCADYNPFRRDCNDAMPLRTLTLTVAGADYTLSFATSNQAEIILPTGTSTPATATVQAVTLRSQAQGPSIGDEFTITDGSIALSITPATGGNDVAYTITVQDGLTPRLLTFGFSEADNSDQDANTEDALTTQAGGANYAGTIDHVAKTVTVVVDAYAKSFDNTRLKAYFTSSDGTTTTIGETVQTTGTIANDFSSAVTYQLAFADGGATAEYTVTVTKVNVAPIPDRNFREILQAAIPNAFQQDNLVIDHTSVASLQNIDIESSFVSSLKGIEFFTGLTTLNCNRNDIDYIDLSQNTALTTLEFKFTQAPSLNLLQNTNLRVLDCSFSNINSLDLSSNTLLTTLDCSNIMALTTLSLANNTALTTLNCRGNRIAVLDLSQNTALTTLNCELNELTMLDLSQNTALEILNCAYNKLMTLDLSPNTALTTVKCDNNPELSSLTLPSEATALSSVMSYLCSLTSLNLQMVRDADADISIYSGNPDRDQFTTLQVNTAIQNNRGMVALKNGRDDAVTISTYDDNNQQVCADYDPRDDPNNPGTPIGCQ